MVPDSLWPPLSLSVSLFLSLNLSFSRPEVFTGTSLPPVFLNLFLSNSLYLVGYWFATFHLIGEIKAYNQILLIVPLTTGQQNHLKLCSVFFFSFFLSHSTSLSSGGTVLQGEGSPVNGRLKMGDRCLQTFFFLYSLFFVYLHSQSTSSSFFSLSFSLFSLAIKIPLSAKKGESSGGCSLVEKIPLSLSLFLSVSASLFHSISQIFSSLLLDALLICFRTFILGEVG